MATAFDPSLGATAANPHDPFTEYAHTQLRYGALDTDQLSLLSNGSPSQAKRALEAHLKDTDRRIQDASRLGTTLLQQRRDLSARLDEVKQVQQENDVPAELRRKLADLEKEYNEVGRESARAFLPKTRITSGGDVTGTPSAFTGSGRESPTKVTAPSRRQRNQPSNRVYDIEFATEISTSLLAQVRQLQTALAEKEEALTTMTAAEAQMQSDLTGMGQRIKQMDENEQRYKDENWNLETRLQELEMVSKDSSDKEHRLATALKATHSEKAAAQRDLDDLKLSHQRLTDEHADVTRQHEADIFTLRREATSHEFDRQKLQKRVDDLTAQNTELAKAVSYRLSQPSAATDSEFVSAEEDQHGSDDTPDPSEPASPVKGTPRHGMLESETLKSSLTHAHRMIQNLKNNIHREKTEKIELKRMLQDARDELEARRSETGIGANVARKRKTENDGKFKKPAKPSTLGASRSGTTEILDADPDWEDHDEQHTPSKSNNFAAAAAGAAMGAAGMAAFDSADADTTDAFETATEREGTSTDAFETGRESMDDEDSDALTETEDASHRANVVRRGVSPLPGVRAAKRRSFLSTASTSASDGEDDQDSPRTPAPSTQPKYRLRVNRGSKWTVGPELPTDSPVSSVGTPQPMGQSLGDELDAMDEGSVGGTPGRHSDSVDGTPETTRMRSVEPDSPDLRDVRRTVELASPAAVGAAIFTHEAERPRPSYADAGIMTDAWEPEPEIRYVNDDHSLREKAEDVVGGALAGLGLGWLGAKAETKEFDDSPATDSVDAEPVERPTTALDNRHVEELDKSITDEAAITAPPLAHSEIVSQETVPISVPALKTAPLTNATIVAQETVPVATPAIATTPLANSIITAQETVPVAAPKITTKASAISNIVAQETVPIAAAAAAVVAPSLTHANVVTQETTPILALQPPKPTPSLATSNIVAQETTPVAAPRPATPVVAPPTAALLTSSAIVAQETEPILAPPSSVPIPILGLTKPISVDTTPQAPAEKAAQALDFSHVTAQDSVPNEIFNSPPALPERASNRLSFVAVPTEDDHQSQALSSADGPHGDRSRSMLEPFEEKDRSMAPLESASEKRTGLSIIYSESAAQTSPRKPFDEVDGNAGLRLRDEPLDIVSTKPLAVDEGSQTAMSGEEIEGLLQNKTTALPITAPVFEDSPARPATAIGPSSGKSIDLVSNEASPLRGPKRPSSAGSTRNRSVVIAPPLPVDHNQKIAAAQKTPAPAAAGSMGPPLMPASAYKQGRPSTPHGRSAGRNAGGQASRTHASPGGVSRRSSMSSFASELDQRFNLQHAAGVYGDEAKLATDPRMIQAITQTMIGEYLWKYTRKAGRSETSSTRHRRFFWVHPYTRTLYWSEKDPSSAGRDMVKAKSVAIEAVRVTTDDNAYPPGLHRKSLIVVTPGREVVFTAPTGQRHETWFNALSYLLLRTEFEKQDADEAAELDEASSVTGAGSIRRSISRMTGRSQSRRSLSSYNSRTTANTNTAHSPSRAATAAAAAALAAHEVPTLTPTLDHAGQRQSATSTTGRMSNSVLGRVSDSGLGTDGTATVRASRTSARRESASGRGRLSSIASKFRTSTTGSTGQRSSVQSVGRGRSSYSTRHAAAEPRDPSDIYDASVVDDSAEDLRAVMARQEQGADRVENVRACCDGKHDVGSLSHRAPLSGSLASRFSTHGTGHGHPKPQTDTLRSRV